MAVDDQYWQSLERAGREKGLAIFDQAVFNLRVLNHFCLDTEIHPVVQ